MSVTDQSSLLQSLQLHEELRTTIDERTYAEMRAASAFV